VASFINPAGLRRHRRQLPRRNRRFGPAEVGFAGRNGRGQIRQGMLEASNVNVVEELVEMIEAQRAYEINSKMVSAVDEMLRNANQTL
jgi:flagellar basal-body rod protein FlgG